jgi:hypothetical protein
MYVVLSETTDDQHVKVSLANQTSDYALPLLLRSNGGTGASGGNGGSGGACGACFSAPNPFIDVLLMPFLKQLLII